MKLNVLCCAAILAAPWASASAQPLGADDIVRQLMPPPALTRSLGAPAARGVVISPGEQDRVLAETASRPAVTIRVLFKYDSDVLTPEGEAALRPVAQALVDPRLGGSRFLVAGYTDRRGSDEYNQSLSERRANAVKDFLVRRHRVGPERLDAMGFGKRKLADPAHPEDPANRRVEVVNLGPTTPGP